MDDQLKKLVAGLSKPPRQDRHLTVRISNAEFLQLQSYCATRYLSYTDALREAVRLLLGLNGSQQHEQ